MLELFLKNAMTQAVAEIEVETKTGLGFFTESSDNGKTLKTQKLLLNIFLKKKY